LLLASGIIQELVDEILASGSCMALKQEVDYIFGNDLNPDPDISIHGHTPSAA